MNNFHTAKIIATIGPAIDKETILAKIVNQIDIFRINLSHGDDDTRKKYVDMVVKLDSSKSIMLDTKWPEIRTRNRDETVFKKWKKVKILYAEFFRQEKNTIFIDYRNLDHVTIWAIMLIDNDTIAIEITENNDGELEWVVKKWGMLLINRNVEFENYIPKLAFLSEKDKKYIIWGAENKANMIAMSYIRDKENIDMIKTFLKEIHGQHLKIIAKIETLDAIHNIEDIVEHTDGIILDRRKLELLVGEENTENTKKNIIILCHKQGKPIIMRTGMNIRKKDNIKTVKTITDEIKSGIDTFMLTKETAVSEDPIDTVTMIYELINNKKNKTITAYSLEDVHIKPEKMITDYIIYNAYRTSKEVPIKAIICPTESWYTPARLSALKPEVPVISFTKNDEAYRYMNLLRWVKGYKISSTFDYTNIKQIGKEIIRILFKGNISLDDKILIVHSSLKQNTSNMINGMELYKFKDI